MKQFDDLLVKILIAAAAVSFFLALMNGETGLTAFLEPSVRWYYSLMFSMFAIIKCMRLSAYASYTTSVSFIDPFSYVSCLVL